MSLFFMYGSVITGFVNFYSATHQIYSGTLCIYSVTHASIPQPSWPPVNLTWRKQIQTTHIKASRALYAINKVKHQLPHSALRTLYYTLIHSHLTYGLELWGNAPTALTLHTLQKRAIRVINNVPYRQTTH